MNEITNEFSEFMERRTFYRHLVKVPKHSFQMAFALALVAETQKCRMNENENNLFSNAAKTLVDECGESFNIYRSELGMTFVHKWNNRDFEPLVSEIIERMSDDFILKRFIESILRNARSELFDDAEFRQYVSGFIVEEHPMRTFVFWLDYIDGLKGTAEYKSWFALKRNLTNLTRIGTAVFSRSEWHSEIARV